MAQILNESSVALTDESGVDLLTETNLGLRLDDATQTAVGVAIAAASNGTKVTAALTATATSIGSTYHFKGRRNSTVVLDLQYSGTLPISSGSIVLPSTFTTVTNSAADIDSGSWAGRIESSDGTKYIEGTLGRSGTDFTLSADLDGVLSLSGSVTCTFPSTLDSSSTLLTRDDSRKVVWVNPNEVFADGYTYGGALSQVTTFPNPAFNTLSDPGVYNNGTLSFSRESDPDSSGKYRYRHYIKPSVMNTWAPTYVASGALDPTWRSEIAIGDSTHACYRGTAYVAGFSVKFGSDVTASGDSVSIFDLHAPDGTGNIGPGPISIMVSGTTVTIWHAYNTVSGGTTSSGKVYLTSTFTINTTDRWHFVLDFKWHYDTAQSPYLKIWTAQGSGSLTSRYDRTDVALGYNEPSLDNYMKAKGGIYLFYPLSDGSTERTVYGKGMYIFQKSAGSPTVDETAMLALLRAQ
jgi:hypothetical protein